MVSGYRGVVARARVYRDRLRVGLPCRTPVRSNACSSRARRTPVRPGRPPPASRPGRSANKNFLSATKKFLPPQKIFQAPGKNKKLHPTVRCRHARQNPNPRPHLMENRQQQTNLRPCRSHDPRLHRGTIRQRSAIRPPTNRRDQGVRMSKARDPDLDLMSKLRARVRIWRSAERAANDERAAVNALIAEAKETGHSYAQIKEATEFGTATIQMILAKAGYLKD